MACPLAGRPGGKGPRPTGAYPTKRSQASTPRLAKYIVDALHAPSSSATITIQLSQRESEILTLLSEGLVKKQIADRLGIGTHTVGDHVKQIYRKLNVPNAPAAVSKAYRSGILRSEENQ